MVARLLNAFVESFSIFGEHVEQHASVGIEVWVESRTHHNEIFQHADLAFCAATREGNRHHAVWDHATCLQSVSHVALIQELSDSFEAGEIVMHDQPIIDMTTKDLVGFESLMRKQRSELGWLPPKVFIPLAEQSDLIFEPRVRHLRGPGAAHEWALNNARRIESSVTVNILDHQFQEVGLVLMIEGALRTSDLSPARLVEIT